jgi:hypothetical protein
VIRAAILVGLLALAGCSLPPLPTAAQLLAADCKVWQENKEALQLCEKLSGCTFTVDDLQLYMRFVDQCYVEPKPEAPKKPSAPPPETTVEI